MRRSVVAYESAACRSLLSDVLGEQSGSVRWTDEASLLPEARGLIFVPLVATQFDVQGAANTIKRRTPDAVLCAVTFNAGVCSEELRVYGIDYLLSSSAWAPAEHLVQALIQGG